MKASPRVIEIMMLSLSLFACGGTQKPLDGKSSESSLATSASSKKEGSVDSSLPAEDTGEAGSVDQPFEIVDTVEIDEEVLELPAVDLSLLQKISKMGIEVRKSTVRNASVRPLKLWVRGYSQVNYLGVNTAKIHESYPESPPTFRTEFHSVEFSFEKLALTIHRKNQTPRTLSLHRDHFTAIDLAPAEGIELTWRVTYSEDRRRCPWPQNLVKKFTWPGSSMDVTDTTTPSAIQTSGYIIRSILPTVSSAGQAQVDQFYNPDQALLHGNDGVEQKMGWPLYGFIPYSCQGLFVF